jgi:hypothetical protein
MTFVEVEKIEKFANGKVVSVNYAIKRYQNGMFIVSYPRSVLNDKMKENVVRITDTYNMKISNSEMNLVLSKEILFIDKKC